MREFKRVWEAMAEMSKADSYGASQCRRCKADWEKAGRPNPETWVPAWLAQDDALGAGPAPPACGVCLLSMWCGKPLPLVDGLCANCRQAQARGDEYAEHVNRPDLSDS